MTSELTVDINDLECLESVGTKDSPYFLYHHKSGIKMPLRGMLWFPEQFLRYVEATQSERIINTYFKAKKEPQIMSNKKETPTRERCLSYLSDLVYQIDCLIDESKDVYIREDPKKGFLHVIDSLGKIRLDVRDLAWGNQKQITDLFKKLEIDTDEEEDSTPE